MGIFEINKPHTIHSHRTHFVNRRHPGILLTEISMKTTQILKPLYALTLLALFPAWLSARGMPVEQRDTIHGLFDSHDKFQRQLTPTEDGYISKTTSTDPKAVELIQAHVEQMESRLKDGLMVRSWDPAYVEFVEHYEDIDIQITKLENGISIVARGKTKEAIAVARNHAGIISKFIDRGWKEHDVAHAAVYGETEATKGMAKMGAMACCQMESKETAPSGEACSTEGEACCLTETGSSDQASAPGGACCRKT